jgi:hypothetical protein
MNRTGAQIALENLDAALHSEKTPLPLISLTGLARCCGWS